MTPTHPTTFGLDSYHRGFNGNVAFRRTDSDPESDCLNSKLPRCFVSQHMIVPGLRSAPSLMLAGAARAWHLAAGVQYQLETFGHLTCTVVRPARSGKRNVDCAGLCPITASRRRRPTPIGDLRSPHVHGRETGTIGNKFILVD